jgi:hypothetical protein
MKNLLIAVCTMGLVTVPLFPQRAGIHPSGGVTRPSGPVLGRTTITENRLFVGARGRFGGGFPWLFPAFGEYGYGDYGFDQTQPNIFVVMPEPQVPPEPPPPPPPPPRAAVQEYHWPVSNTAPAPFSIVLNDGTVHYATMVWLADGRLHFNSPEGGARQLPLSSVSRTLTQSANARKGLTLPLP